MNPSHHTTEQPPCKVAPQLLDAEGINDFRDILLRLSFAAHGWDDRLDGVLERLQDDLRRDHDLPDLKQYAETLYRALMRAEEHRPARQPSQVVAKVFGDLALPPHLQERWQNLMAEARQARNEIQSLQVLEMCATVLNRALSELAAGSAKRPGLLASLFRGDSRDDDQPDRLLKAVQHRLLELISSLCPPPEMENRLEKLKEEVTHGLLPDRLPDLLEQVNLLIQDIRGRVERERQELEKFLGQLMERLSTIETALEESDDSTRRVFRNRERLDAEIEEQTRDMETHAREATDLRALKDQVQQRVDTIRQRMSAHHEQEQQLLKEREAQVQALRSRLKAMEAETQTLRTQVHEERRQAFTDALTGLPNRFAYEERLEQEFARWQRYGSPLSLVIVDVDHFKRINDNYGHQAGDKALRIIAQELAEALRKTDFIGRYGGEEIVILMPETPVDSAMVAAEKLRKRIEGCGFHFRDQRVTITISCGLSEFRKGDDPDSAFERADEALYRAKKEGRNRCVAA